VGATSGDVFVEAIPTSPCDMAISAYHWQMPKWLEFLATTHPTPTSFAFLMASCMLQKFFYRDPKSLKSSDSRYLNVPTTTPSPLFPSTQAVEGPSLSKIWIVPRVAIALRMKRSFDYPPIGWHIFLPFLCHSSTWSNDWVRGKSDLCSQLRKDWQQSWQPEGTSKMFSPIIEVLSSTPCKFLFIKVTLRLGTQNKFEAAQDLRENGIYLRTSIKVSSLC